MLASTSLSRSLLVALVMTSIFPSNTQTKNNDDWIVPAVAGAVGGAIIGSAIATWCKNSEINEIDYRPLTSLKELNAEAYRVYGKLLDTINDTGTHFYDYDYLKKSLRKRLPYELFITDFEHLECEIRRARKQLKNQIKYWDKRLHDGYAEAKHILTKTKITYKKLQALRKLAQEMLPILQLEQAVYDAPHDYALYYDELSIGYTNIYQATDAWHNNETNYAHFIMNLAHRSGNQYPLISYAERLLNHAKALRHAIKNASADSLNYKADNMYQILNTTHSILTQSAQYKAEVMYQKDMKHKQKMQEELEKQTRLAQKQLNTAQAQLYAQQRTESQIAQLRFENAVRDLYN